MKLGLKLAIAALVVAGLSVGVAWWWVHNMERKLVAARTPQGAHPDQEFFALKKLLQRQGIAVEIRDHLSEAQAHASTSDAIFLAQGSPQFPASLAAPLIAWIEKGGTMVGQTPWYLDSTDEHFFHPLGVRIRNVEDDDSEEAEDTTEGLVPQPGTDTTTDSVEVRSSDTATEVILSGLPGGPADTALGDSTDSVTSLFEPDEDTVRALPDSGVAFLLPGASDTLRILFREWDRRVYPVTPAMVAWHDTLDSAVMVLARGRGFVVALSNSGLFDSDELQQLDHAELALRLFSWKQKPTTVWIVRQATIMPWWAWLWDRAWAILLGAAILAALWFWNRVRRFGPALPDPDTDRRPLLEHIDASARWIWNAPDGPDTLLSALRAAVRRDLAVRHPAWVGLAPEELAQELARLHGLSPSAVRRALSTDSDKNRQHAPSPQELVRTVKILQKLKERA